jgi:hypothetical protein
MADYDSDGRSRKGSIVRLLVILGVTVLCVFGLAMVAGVILVANAMSNFGSNK